MYKILWSGLADKIYYDVIAQYCIPSWTKLPGDKNIIHDQNAINIKGINVIPWNIVPNLNSKFLEKNPRKKTWSFWRKMQSQVWTARKFKINYDFIILLDTDIEILNSFDVDKLEKELNSFKESNHVWATGRSQSRLHDSGFIILNTDHKLYDSVISDYENIWESGKIHELRKAYDGIAVESMFDQYPSYKLMNTDYGKGFHVYNIGMVHYGSKMPKSLRREWEGDGQSLVDHHTRDINIKSYK